MSYVTIISGRLGGGTVIGSVQLHGVDELVRRSQVHLDVPVFRGPGTRRPGIVGENPP